VMALARTGLVTGRGPSSSRRDTDSTIDPT
jgi:hypothetical protein